MKIINIWADGGCRNNQSKSNIGGYGVVLEYGKHKKELYAAERNTTNNAQELKGAINALKALKTTDIPIHMYIDSAYVINGINKWVKGWKKRGWRKSNGKVIENLELWKELDRLVSLQDDIQILKVKGHNGDEGNERADALVNLAMDEIEVENQ